jgi:hypothetical protein
MTILRSLCGRPIHRLTIVSAGIFLLGQTGCASGNAAPKQTMHSSQANTSGEGTVQANAAANGNTRLEVAVKHLSSPSKVASDASVYVVWIQPHDAQIQNVGALEVNDDLVGKLSTTTPHRTFKLTITPEPSARMAMPTHPAVFSSDVNRID